MFTGFFFVHNVAGVGRRRLKRRGRESRDEESPNKPHAANTIMAEPAMQLSLHGKRRRGAAALRSERLGSTRWVKRFPAEVIVASMTVDSLRARWNGSIPLHKRVDEPQSFITQPRC